jgi:hypothetical protein
MNAAHRYLIPPEVAFMGAAQHMLAEDGQVVTVEHYLLNTTQTASGDPLFVNELQWSGIHDWQVYLKAWRRSRCPTGTT